MGKVEICNVVQEPRNDRDKGDATMMRSGIKARNKSISLYLFVLICFFYGNAAFSQYSDAVYKENIKAVRFHIYGDQESLPVYKMNSGDQLELNFDDLDANVKSYYYSFQLCDYDWKPIDISPFFIYQGFYAAADCNLSVFFYRINQVHSLPGYVA